jgi:hypothetical protein
MEALAAGDVIIHMLLIEHEQEHCDRHRRDAQPPPSDDQDDDPGQQREMFPVLLAELDHPHHAWTIAPLRVAPQAVEDNAARLRADQQHRRRRTPFVSCSARRADECTSIE